MKEYDPKIPLFSIHIPKCAGTSFLDVLRSWFGTGLLLHYHDEKRDRPPKKYRLHRGVIDRRYRPGLCVHGHFNAGRGNGVLDYYPKAQQLITIIRDPFDIHLSNYFYAMRESKVGRGFHSGKPHQMVTEQWSLTDYLRENPVSFVSDFFPPQMTIENYRQLIDEKFLYIGITEDLQGSLDRLAAILGYPRIPVPEKNVTDWTAEIPDGAREEFIGNNSLVMAVYDHARDSYAA